MLNCVLITNIPAPYREKVHELVYKDDSLNYEIIYCSDIESNRKWKFERGEYKFTVLKSRQFKFGNRDVYLGSNILNVLRKRDFDVVILSGFSLPMLTAYVWAKLAGKKVISFTDAHINFEKRLTFIHKILRKLIYSTSDACIGASQKSLQLFQSYGVDSKQCFQSHLCINNENYFQIKNVLENRKFDLILCGRICHEKMIDFQKDVILELKKLNENIKVLIVGDGPEKQSFLDKLDKANVDYLFTGFVGQSELPELYSSAKVFLFPSINDAWGVVANEACAAGTPTISCKEVGAADELLIHGDNALILNTDVDLWVREITRILNDSNTWNKMSKSCLEKVKPYNFSNAAKGIILAVESTKNNE